MFLRKLELNNFRNISKIDFEFNKNINIFIGNNAQGKTNVLESIYFLAITRSHRTHNELNLIKNDALYTKVSVFWWFKKYPYAIYFIKWKRKKGICW